MGWLDLWLTLRLKNVRLFCLCVLLTLWISSMLAKAREEKSAQKSISCYCTFPWTKMALSEHVAPCLKSVIIFLARK